MSNNLPFAARLTHREVIRITGSDRIAFLQGLISNDINKVHAESAIYAALLTPQGKFLHDLFILEYENGFLIDCERAEDLLRRLAAYKLRANVTFENVSDRFDVWVIWRGVYKAALTYQDPRLAELGMRGILPKGVAPTDVDVISAVDYDQHRVAFGVTDASRDLEFERSTLAEGNIDYLNGIDWKKGCYIGQELTARMHYRGLAKKRLFPVHGEGLMPKTGTPILLNGLEVGEMRSSVIDRGLALLSIEAVQKAIEEKSSFSCANSHIHASKPEWMAQKG